MKTQQEIENMIDDAADACDNPKMSGMTYEEGVRYALEWVMGDVDDDELLS